MFQKIINAQYRRPSGWLGQWIGQRMAQQHIPENEWTIRILNARSSDHILEIGFGPGLAIKHLTGQITGGQITGIDYSQAMVRAASRRNSAAVQAGLVDLHCGDVHDLPFDDATFDRVFSIHSIYFWPDPTRALKEIHRVMKIGGTLVLTLLPADSPQAGTAEFKPYTGYELVDLLEQAGFIQPHILCDEMKVSPSNFSVVALR